MKCTYMAWKFAKWTQMKYTHINEPIWSKHVWNIHMNTLNAQYYSWSEPEEFEFENELSVLLNLMGQPFYFTTAYW